METSKIRTPHAAVKIWNYVDRINVNGASPGQGNVVKEEIISTISLMSIQTSKSKGDPVGTFSFVLAPTRNWTATITPGSWCVIMMSNKALTKESFKHADKDLVKMIGKIISVRVDVSVDNDGARQTRYLVSGQDWGHVLNNILYVDPLISDQLVSKESDGNALYKALIKTILNEKGIPLLNNIATNLYTLLGLFGKPIDVPDESRLPKATHSLLMPSQMVDFFQFVDKKGKAGQQSEISKIITLKTGKLEENGTYKGVGFGDGLGWIDPYALVGSHTLWQILQDNSNYALNEMLTEINWLDNGPQLTLYNRIKPFSFQAKPAPGAATSLRSKFQYIPTNVIDNETVISINAGTSWQDKFNFIEIKPDMQEFKVFDNWVKQKSQVRSSRDVFNREGFRPLIFSIKQVPTDVKNDTVEKLNINKLSSWLRLIKEWYFDSHRLLNGQLTMTGSTEYIPVGNNIMFDAGLLNITPNYNSESSQKEKIYVLGHVESVQHNFSVNNDTRTYQTIVRFVRGVLVNSQKQLIGEGTIDTLSTTYSKEQSKNSVDVVASPTDDIPEKE